MPKTVATTTPKASENIKLNPPKPFTGKWSNFILFMQDVFIYLKVNRSIYDDDEKKISFILSYLADGDAAVWKQQFIQTKIEESVEVKTDKPSWGNYKEFVEALKKMFQPYDEPAEALEDMKKLHLGDGSITKHNSKFRLLMSQTGMKDSLVLMDLYRETLPWGLQSPIIRSKHPPKMLEEWYTKATNFYIGHQRAQRLFKKWDNKPTNTTSALPAQKRFSFPEKKDPNAMDIDCMTIEEHTRLWRRANVSGADYLGISAEIVPTKTEWLLHHLHQLWNRLANPQLHTSVPSLHPWVRKKRRRWKKKEKSMVWVFKAEDCLDVSTSLIYFLSTRVG
jgi:Retrotransposon gag protein